MYKINIIPEPEMINDRPMYFWSIIWESGENHYNCGHGWAESIISAAEEADKYYRDVIVPMTNNG